MKHLVLVCWILSVLPVSGADAPSPVLGLTVSPDGTLLREGRPFRGIGVNYFDAFARTLADPPRTDYEAGFRVLGAQGIPFARIEGCGFWPRDMRLYQTDKAEYFRRLDGVVQSAQRNHVGLIPSLFWMSATVPDLVGEPRSAWGDPHSRTHAFLRTYVQEVVTRYRQSPAIWGWEFGNEYNLDADLPNAASHRPPVVPVLGTAGARGPHDDVTHDQVRTAIAAFAREVRRHDPQRLIVSGNSIPREAAWHMRAEHSWKHDTPQQFAEMLAGDNPDPVNCLCIHAYEGNIRRIGEAMTVARAVHKPLVVGEFGIPGPPTPESQRQFAEALAILQRESVPLAALWVYDFAHQKEWTVTLEHERRYQLEAIAEANRRLRGDSSH